MIEHLIVTRIGLGTSHLAYTSPCRKSVKAYFLDPAYIGIPHFCTTENQKGLKCSSIALKLNWACRHLVLSFPFNRRCPILCSHAAWLWMGWIPVGEFPHKFNMQLSCNCHRLAANKLSTIRKRNWFESPHIPPLNTWPTFCRIGRTGRRFTPN